MPQIDQWHTKPAPPEFRYTWTWQLADLARAAANWSKFYVERPTRMYWSSDGETA